MSQAARALAKLLWLNEPAEGETIAVCLLDEWVLLEVCIPEGQPEKFLRQSRLCRRRWTPAFNNDADYVISGTLLSIDPRGQPMWWVKNYLAQFLFHVLHAV